MGQSADSDQSQTNYWYPMQWNYVEMKCRMRYLGTIQSGTNPSHPILADVEVVVSLPFFETFDSSTKKTRERERENEIENKTETKKTS